MPRTADKIMRRAERIERASAAAIQSPGACSDQPSWGRETVSGAVASATNRLVVVDQQRLEAGCAEIEPEIHQAAGRSGSCRG
jgi:hypothetical protein